jgi:alpha-galactosidase/6-phospho-beta-glucosidase family protein
MKIAFIGGGSVQWTPGLVTDMALTGPLSGAELVLHDLDANALDLLAHASRRIVKEVAGNLNISTTTNRIEALRDADFVILCVGIGGLAAMRNDLKIPEQYGVYQSVGDTVGPGGLARGLRHIPFAVQVAQEMEEFCPQAWLLNLTNPMTTICRSITRTTTIRAIGLCHEVDIFRDRHLSPLFGVPAEKFTLAVAGINHLPIILNMDVDGRDGMDLLRQWLAEHNVFEFTNDHVDDVRNIFKDRLAVKLSLFEKLGVLFGAGDRHVAEFLPGFLTEEAERGARYGVVLTTVDHRQELARQRRVGIEAFVNENAPEELKMSFEQLAPVMAALSGGPPVNCFVNIPNQGQISNLPLESTVECVAQIDALGVRPLAVGELPYPAYAAIAPHVARQELIVEAALTGRRQPALAALTTDPLVHDPEIAKPMLDELLAANAKFMTPDYLGQQVTFKAIT